MRVEVLGTVQDGGVPHLGCRCEVCTASRDRKLERKITSLLLREDSGKESVRYLIDATPDIRYQIKGDYLDGVFVPHANIGPMTGLLFFGEEGLDADRLSVYCNDAVEHYMMNNDPYRMLFDRENIQTVEFEDGDEERLQGATIEAVGVYHPQVNHDTTGYMIRGEEKSLFYLSDITEWNDKLRELIEEADIALIDGTFWSEDEIERYEEVPHPTIQETMDEMEDVPTDIYFTHFNHTNPVILEESEEREEVEERGFNVAKEGQEFKLD